MEEEYVFSAHEIEQDGGMLEEEEEEEFLIDPLTGERLVAHDYDALRAHETTVCPS